MNRLPFIPPGEILFEEFINQVEVARNAGIPASRLTEIIKGRRSITAETALRLSLYFGTTAAFWLGLQAEHDLEVAEQEFGKRIKSEVHALAAKA
jgi:addiction module HigA family antidote